jgi:hypothetical protein
MLLCQRTGLGFSPLDLRRETAWLPFPMFGMALSGTENVVWDPRFGDDTYIFDYWYEDDAERPAIPGRRRLTCAVVPLGGCPACVWSSGYARRSDETAGAGDSTRGVRSPLRLNRRSRFAMAFLDPA